MKKGMPEITPAVMSSVTAYLLAKAYAEVERERVDAIQNKILAEAVYMADKKHSDRRGGEQRITEGKQAWLMSDADHRDYLETVRWDLEKAGYAIKSAGPDRWDYFCPALVSEDILRKTEWLIIDSMAEMINAGDGFQGKLLSAGLKKYQDFIALTVKMVLAYPKYTPPTI
jgi:hypothetical protein